MILDTGEFLRRNDGETWIQIGESAVRSNDFAVLWDTTRLKDGKYQMLGLMHVFVKKGVQEFTVARKNIFDVTIEN